MHAPRYRIERTPYGLEHWRGFHTERRWLLRELQGQTSRNQRYCFRGYQPGAATGEAMLPAPFVLEEAAIGLQALGVDTGLEVNTARLKWYDGRSRAYQFHADPSCYHLGPDGAPGRITLYSLSGLAVLLVHTPGGGIDSFACEAGTVISLPAHLPHAVTPPIGEERRCLAFFGFDTAMQRLPCGFTESGGTNPLACHVGHYHQAAVRVG